MPELQAFEGLLTIAPILLVAVISILLRARASRRRKRMMGEGDGDSDPRSPAARSPAAGARASEQPGGAAQPLQFPWQRKAGQVYPGKQPAAAVPRQSGGLPGSMPAAGRESYTYPPPLSLNGLKATTPVAADEQGRLIPVPLTASEGSGAQGSAQPAAIRQSMRRRPETKTAGNLRERMQALGVQPSRTTKTRRSYTIAGRLERLPPLKRALIWSEILGPPGGRE